MKKKTTMTYITGSFRKVWRCGYCDLQYIMKGIEPNFYNSGVYGWNCNIYIDWLHDTAITTGYRNMRGERIPDEIIEEFTERAKDVINNFKWTNYDEYRHEMDRIRTAFFNRLAGIDKEPEELTTYAQKHREEAREAAQTETKTA